MSKYRICGRDWEARGLTRVERLALEKRGLSMMATNAENAAEVLDAVLAVLWPQGEAQEMLDQADQADIDTLYQDIFSQTYPIEPGKGIKAVPKADWPAALSPVRGLKRFEDKELRAERAKFRKGAETDGFADIDALADATLAVVYPSEKDQAILDSAPNAVCLSIFQEIQERSRGKGAAVKN